MYYQSKNWRANFHRFKGSTYAQAVKGKVKVNSSQPAFKAKVYSHANLTKHKAKARMVTPINSNPPSKSDSMVMEVRVVTNQVQQKPFQIHTTNRFEPLTRVHKVDDPKQPITSDHHIHTGTCSEGVKKSIVPKNPSRCNAPSSEFNEHTNISPTGIDYTGWVTEDKYTFAMAIASKRKCYKSALKECKTLQQWDAQNAKKFHFIPMGDLPLPSTNLTIQSESDPLKLHNIVKNSGAYSFLGSQIQIRSQLNPDAWDHHLKDYWDKQLPYLIRYGFPLDFDRSTPLKQEGENYNSAKHYPSQIWCHIRLLSHPTH